MIGTASGGNGSGPAAPEPRPGDPEITPELVADHGLTPEEYDKIVGHLGRTPTFTELGVFSAMWSEHCGYKNSKRLLRLLPTEAPWVIQGPGENAGVIDIGDGVCWLLDRTALGDFLIIRDSEQREHYVYTVTEVVSVRWNDPNGVAYLRPSDTAIVTLVTCEGAFDRDANNYSNRRIVVAEMTDIVPFTDEAG